MFKEVAIISLIKPNHVPGTIHCRKEKEIIIHLQLRPAIKKRQFGVEARCLTL